MLCLIDDSAPSAFLFRLHTKPACISLTNFFESTHLVPQSTKAENKRLQTELQSLKNSLNDPSNVNSGKSASSQAPPAGKEQKLQERKIQDLGTQWHVCGVVLCQLPPPSAD